MNAFDLARRDEEATQRNAFEDRRLVENCDVPKRAVEDGHRRAASPKAVGDHGEAVHVAAAAQRQWHVAAALEAPVVGDVRALPSAVGGRPRLSHAETLLQQHRVLLVGAAGALVDIFGILC